MCHRWFHAGEGWAWAADFPPAVRESLLRCLQQDVSELRKLGRKREYSVHGGSLLVRTKADPDCPDRLARSRSPVLITAVYVSGIQVKEIQEMEIASMLDEAENKSRRAEAPGAVSSWTVALPERLQAIRKQRTVNVMKKLVLITIFAACGIIAMAQNETVMGWFLRGKNAFDPNADQKDIRDWADASWKQMERWRMPLDRPEIGSKKGDSRSKAVNAFLRFLSLEHLSEASSSQAHDSKHIDGEYLRRLPKSAKEFNSTPEEVEVRSAMLSLLNDLGGKEESAKPPGNPASIISEIAVEMNFRTWYTSAARKVCFTGRFMPLQEEERNYVYRFCPSMSGGDVGGLNQKMYEIMTKEWGLDGLRDEDVRKRPWFIAGCFFEFLSQAAVEGLPEPAASRPADVATKQSESSLVATLRETLPKGSLLSRDGLRGDNPDRHIKDALRELAKKHIKVPTDGRDDRTILEDLQKRLKALAESTLEGRPDNSKSEVAVWYFQTLACRRPPSKPAPAGSGK